MNLNELTIKEARFKLDRREITALDLTKACLERIKEIDQDIKACLALGGAEVLKEAQEADRRLQVGETGPLLGIPYLCKDNIMAKGWRTTAASRILEGYVAPYDATVIARLRTAGAILLGKTNLDEFAHGASTENSAFGPTRNPLDQTRVPGGSSGGSAAAVAANMCLFALGSDTGGSIRQPASFCGLVGLKPSYGRVSRFGLLSMTSSTDVIGPLAKTVTDAALVLAVIAGQDGRDATSAPGKVSAEELELSLKATDWPGLKVGWPKEYFLKELDPEIRKLMEAAADRLEEAGAEIVEVSLPHAQYGIPVYYIITPAEISSNLARFDGVGWGLSHPADNLQEFYKQNRGNGFGPEAKRRIMLGAYVLSAGYYDAYYKQAQLVRNLIRQDFAAAFEKVDLLLTPTTPHPAFKIGEQVNNPLAMYLEDVFVTGASLAGLPALSVPAGKINDLPIGAQLIAPRLGEAQLFKAAQFLEDISK